MRNAYRFLLVAVTVAGLALLAAPTAAAESKDQPSSNGPWVIGLAVVVALALAVLLLRLRSGMRKRDPERHFRSS